jgi:hypothetical protein
VRRPRWPNDRAQRRSHGRLIYDRDTSLRMVCQGFGTDTGGLSINWLNWGMKCAIVAKAIGARYHLDPMFTMRAIRQRTPRRAQAACRGRLSASAR